MDDYWQDFFVKYLLFSGILPIAGAIADTYFVRMDYLMFPIYSLLGIGISILLGNIFVIVTMVKEYKEDNYKDRKMWIHVILLISKFFFPIVEYLAALVGWGLAEVMFIGIK